jgi:metal-sulfur cluster biosynthetic enzyme
MTLTPAAIFEALRAVPEPCSIAMSVPQDIVSMGLVEDIRVEGSAVALSLVLTDPSCVHFTAIRRYITDVLLELDGITSVEVRMSTTQLWTPDRMNPTAPSKLPVRTLLPLVTT